MRQGQWLPRTASKSLTDGMVRHLANGVKTGTDKEWIQTKGDQDFATRHAYRPLDNRWSPTEPPIKAKPGEERQDDQASEYARWQEKKLFDPHASHAAAGGWYAILQPPSVGVKPGPAIHATRHMPDYHAFKGSEGGKVVRVGKGVEVPAIYRDWVANQERVTGPDFWSAALAAANHPEYWVEGTMRARELSERSVCLTLPSESRSTQRLIKIGERLVDVWSLDKVEPVPFEGKPGLWSFAGHDDVEQIDLHGYRVLSSWRSARPFAWDRPTAQEYARTVSALLEMVRLRTEVAVLIP